MIQHKSRWGASPFLPAAFQTEGKGRSDLFSISFLFSSTSQSSLHGGNVQQEAVMEGVIAGCEALFGCRPADAGRVSLPAALLMDRVWLHRSPLMRAAKGHGHG